jgi:hypothetical protein
MAIRKPAFITKQIRGGRPVATRPYKWGPGVPSLAIQFDEIPTTDPDPFAEFQLLLCTQDGRNLLSADNNYIAPN